MSPVLDAVAAATEPTPITAWVQADTATVYVVDSRGKVHDLPLADAAEIAETVLALNIRDARSGA